MLWLALTILGSAATSAQRPAGSPAGDVTFTKDIAPILQRSCQNCHRPDGVAPMSLVTYEEVRPWARAIKQRTGIGPHRGVMPPWYIEKNIGIQQLQERPVAERRRDREDRASGPTTARRTATRPTCRRPRSSATWRRLDDRRARPRSSGPKEIVVKANAPDWWGEIESVPIRLTEDRYVVRAAGREVNDITHGGTGRATVGGRYVFHHMIWSTRVDDASRVDD